MTRTTRRLTAGAASLALLLAACGSDGDSADTPETTAPTTTAEAPETTQGEETTTTEAEAEGTDLVATAEAAGDFTTLLAALDAAELTDTLATGGPFTVFAPSDEAFAALPEGTVEGLLEDPSGALTDILTTHVVEGIVLAADVVELDGQEVTTLGGTALTVQVGEDGSVALVDGSGATVGVVATDVEASNGVIHVLDGVLMPS